MTITPFQALACPIDGSALQLSGTSWQCDAGHNFDIARQGYVHLLPVQNKRSKDPGDNKAMVAARQRFLDAGFYRPIAEALCHAVLHKPHGETAINCLDAGCGEGYYMRYLAAKTPETSHLALLGLDISKWSVLSAAKQHKAPAWVVGSNANLPILSGTLDYILCVFGFPVYQEFGRVLRPGGEIVQVDAGPNHLIELRKLIYSELKEPRKPPDAPPEGFTAVDRSTVHFDLVLPNKHSVSDLLAMTPHLYRASAEGLARATELESLRVTVEAVIRRFKKN